MIRSIDWITNYNGFIGTLTKATADAWATVIRENVPNVKAKEVDDAVALLCSQERAPNAARPNAQTIIAKIKELRGYKFNQGHKPTPNNVRYVDGSGRLMQTTMADLKGFLQRRPPAEEAWDIICTPMDSDQCKELHRFADDHNIAYQRFNPTINDETVKHIASLYTA